MSDVLNQLLQTRIIAIIRNARPADVPEIAKALAQGGVTALEITLNSPKALQVIEELTDSVGDQLLIGAGTVLDPESAKEAISAGAKFIISPALNTATIDITKRHGIISIPGAFTPTEILTAYTAGGDIIKVFPASVGASYISDILGPLSHIPLMPTGGVNLGNIADFKKAGAVAYGIGSALFNHREEVNQQSLAELTSRAKKFRAAIS